LDQTVLAQHSSAFTVGCSQKLQFSSSSIISTSSATTGSFQHDTLAASQVVLKGLPKQLW